MFLAIYVDHESYDFFCLQMPDVGSDKLFYVNDEYYFLFA